VTSAANTHSLEARLDALQAGLASLDGLVVAFSGGTDSAFLLAAAAKAMGASGVVAATAVSPSLPAAELEAAATFARGLGVAHHTPRTHELQLDGYVSNAGDRCYFCKSELLDVLRPLAERLGIAHVATGTNADDAVAGFRPGIRAASERGALTPLLDAGLTKSEVRVASREWGLSTWDKPAAACLSSRIAYGVAVTAPGLARVGAAEEAVRGWLSRHQLSARDVRVRDLGDDVARVEVDDELVGAASGAADAAVSAGFRVATVERFRSGSMNELLPDPRRWR
jgi:uncharacterized protein